MEYDVSKIEKVKIADLNYAGWNPKTDAKGYQKVKHSIEVNGIVAPLFVRETDNGLELVDGHQRCQAMKELGYEDVYVYNLGRMSEAEAKQFVLWMAVQVPFDEVLLAPLVMELDGMNVELPFDNREMDKFRSLESFDMSFGDEEPIEEEEGVEKPKSLRIRMTEEQLWRIQARINEVCANENVSEGRSLELLCQAGAVNLGLIDEDES